MHRQQQAAKQRSQNRSESPHTQRPTRAGGAHVRRVEVAREGIEGQLPADDAEPCCKHAGHQVAWVVVVQAQQNGAQRCRRQHAGQQPHFAFQTVGKPGHEDGAQGASEQEHGGDQVGFVQCQAAFEQ